MNEIKESEGEEGRKGRHRVNKIKEEKNGRECWTEKNERLKHQIV